MATTTYATVNGVIVGENVNGQLRDYMPDTLGSTAALLDNTQTQTANWTYWPYGEVRTGGTATRFLYVGTLGYRSDDSSRAYVRARELHKAQARWMQVDPLWPGEPSYNYARVAPPLHIDQYGLKPAFNIDPDCAKFGQPFSMAEFVANKACERYLECLADPICKRSLEDCLRAAGCTTGKLEAKKLLDCMKKNCDGTTAVDIWCCKKNCCGCDGSQWFRTYEGNGGSRRCDLNFCYNFDTLSPQLQVSEFLHEISHCCGTPDYSDDTSIPCAGQAVGACMRKILHYH